MKANKILVEFEGKKVGTFKTSNKVHLISMALNKLLELKKSEEDFTPLQEELDTVIYVAYNKEISKLLNLNSSDFHYEEYDSDEYHSHLIVTKF